MTRTPLTVAKRRGRPPSVPSSSSMAESKVQTDHEEEVAEHKQHDSALSGEESEHNETLGRPATRTQLGRPSAPSPSIQGRLTPSPITDSSHQMRHPSLFGQSLSNLPAPPTLVSADKFTEWKTRFVNYATMNNFHYLLKGPYTYSWNLAQEYNWNHLSDKQLKLIYTQLNEKIVASISSAVLSVLPNMQSILDDIQLQHSSELDRFLPSIDDAFLVWSKLCTMYEHRTMYSVVGTWNQLFGLRYKEGTDPTTLWNEFQLLNTKLITALKDDKLLPGQVLTEQCKAAILLNAIPKSMIVDHSIMMNKDKVAPMDVITHLARKYESVSKDPSRSNIDSDAYQEQANSFTSSQPHRHHRTNTRGHGSKHKSKRKNERHHSRDNSDTDEESKDDTNWHQSFYLEEDTPSRISTTRTINALTAIHKDAPKPTNSRRVILDSGSTCHVWNNDSGVINQRSTTRTILSALGDTNTISNLGTVQLTPNICLTDVVLVKKAPANLISVHRVMKSGCRVLMHHNQAQILNKCGRVVLTFRKDKDGLYVYNYRSDKHTNQLSTTTLARTGTTSAPVSSRDSPPSSSTSD